MSPEKYTPPEARPEGFETTQESTERMAKEAAEEGKYDEYQQMVLEAFRGAAAEDPVLKDELDQLIHETNIFDGTYDAAGRLLMSAKSLSERQKMSKDEVMDAIRGMAAKQLPNLLEKAGGERRAAA